MFSVIDIVARSSMAARTLRAVNLRARLEHIFADPEGSVLRLPLDASIQRQPDDLFLKRERRVSHRDRKRAELEIGKEPNGDGNNAEQETEKHLAKAAAAAFFRHLESLLGTVGPR